MGVSHLDRQELRQSILSARRQLPLQDVNQKSQMIVERLCGLSQWHHAQTVLLYVAFRNEVETRSLIDRAVEEGKRVLLPVSIKKTRALELYPVLGSHDLVEGAYGIMEPRRGQEPIPPTQVDLVVVPGVVFDRSGNRLGYGAGYYDRFLESCRPEVVRVALAFDLQLIDHLPAEPHDQRMDYVITETELHRCPPRD